MTDFTENQGGQQKPRASQAANGYRPASGRAPVGPGPMNPGPRATVGMADLWVVVRRWGWRCASAGLALALAASAVVWFTFSPKYEASAWLEIRDQPFVLAFKPRNESRSFVQTQLQTMRSPVVLSSLSGDPKIAEFPEAMEFDSPLEWLQKGLNANIVGQSDLCEVKFTSRDAAMSAYVANAVVRAFLALHGDKHGEMNTRIIKLLKEEKLHLEEEVRIARDRVRVLTKQATENDPTLVHQDLHSIIVPQNPIAGLEDRKTTAQVERAVLEARLKAHQESVDADQVEVSAGELAMVLEDHPEIVALKKQLAAARANLREHKQRSSRGDADPQVPKLAKQAKGLEDALQKATDELRPLLLDEIRGHARARRLVEIAELQRKGDDQRLLEQLYTIIAVSVVILRKL